MRRIRRVAILGSSISMVVRPREGLPYPRVLEGLLNEAGDDVWLVDNLSRIAATVDDVAGYLPKLVADRPETVVFHYGHVEPILRPHSRAEWHRTYGIIVGESKTEQRIRFARQKGAGARRRVGWRTQWTPPDRFRRVFGDALAYLRKETAPRLIVLEANPGDAKIEQWGPGSCAAIAEYNDVMRELAQAQGAEWLALDQVFPGGELHVPDGTHFTPEAHVAVAKALAARVLA